MDKVKLCWIEDLGCAHLVSVRIPYQTTRVCIAQVCINQDFDDRSESYQGRFLGWKVRMYVSIMWPVNDVIRPATIGAGVRDNFKEARKVAEQQARNYFKALGVEVEIEPPTFLKELPYTLDKQKIPQAPPPNS